MNEFAGPMFWIFGEIPEFSNIFIFGFPDRRRLEGVRSFVFWDRTNLVRYFIFRQCVCVFGGGGVAADFWKSRRARSLEVRWRKMKSRK